MTLKQSTRVLFIHWNLNIGCEILCGKTIIARFWKTKAYRHAYPVMSSEDVYVGVTVYLYLYNYRMKI